MAFHYDPKTFRLVDPETGIEIFARGRAERQSVHFIFFDPRSSARFYYANGEFHFEAKFILRSEYPEEGSIKVRVRIEGFEIRRIAFESSFAAYTGSDATKILAVCDLVAAGLREWLLKRDKEKNAKILFV